MRARPQEVIAMIRPCFDAVALLREAEGIEDPAARKFHDRIAGLIDEVREQAAAAGLDRRDVDDIIYALVALIDEAAIGRGGALQNVWMLEPLQARFFDETTAGEGFFRKVEALMASDRPHALLVFYLCLLFGFEGKFKIRGGAAEFSELQAALSERVFPPGEELPALSPAGARPESGEQEGPRRRAIVASTGAALLLACVFYVGLRLDLQARCAALDEAIGQVQFRLSNREGGER